MDWKIAEANKQKISELVKAAEDEPQARILGEAFGEFRRICEEEGYALEIQPRQERSNHFLKAIAAAPLRPKMTWDSLRAMTREP
jgi:hypothetical protein